MPVEEAVEAPEEADPFVTRVPPQAASIGWDCRFFQLFLGWFSLGL